MNETYTSPTACSDPITYHNRVMRRWSRRAERINHFAFGLLKFSLVLFAWALTTAVLVGMAH